LLKRLCKRIGVKEFGFHALRHKVASILMDSGKANLSAIQHFLRHKKATTTELYLKSLSPGGQVMEDILDAHCEEQTEVKKTRKVPKKTENCKLL
jgi:integrase